MIEYLVSLIENWMDTSLIPEKIECMFWCKKDTSSRVSEEENISVYSKMLFRSFSLEIWQVFRK